MGETKTTKRPERSDFVPDPHLARTQMLQESVPVKFDPDAWVAMDRRDDALIEDELLHGAQSAKFVYKFAGSDGKEVSGISVIGARELATHYKGIKHRLVASMRKSGSTFIFTQYPNAGRSMSVAVQSVPELRDEMDGYTAVVEIQDIKTGNCVMTEKFEPAREWSAKRHDYYERPHHATIAQAKAYRNGVLSLISQAVQIQWKMEMLKLGKTDEIAGSVLDEKRNAIIAYAAKHGIAVNRQATLALGMTQISGLREAATEGRDAFVASAKSLGIYVLTPEEAAVFAANRGPSRAAGQPAAQKPPAKPAATTSQAAPQQSHAPPPTNDIDTQKSALPPRVDTFEAFLVDANGELIDHAPFVDPVAWAESFAAVWRASEDGASLLDANAGAFADACEAHSDAERILTGLTDAQLWSPPILTLGDDRGRPAWTAYVRSLREILAQATADQLFPIAAANGDTFAIAPPGSGLLIQKAFSERAAALGCAAPVTIAAVAQQPTADPASRDVAFVDARIADLRSFESRGDRHGLEAFWRGAAIQAGLARLTSDNSGEAERLKAVYRDILTAMGG